MQWQEGKNSEYKENRWQLTKTYWEATGVRWRHSQSSSESKAVQNSQKMKSDEIAKGLVYL